MNGDCGGAECARGVPKGKTTDAFGMNILAVTNGTSAP